VQTLGPLRDPFATKAAPTVPPPTNRNVSSPFNLQPANKFYKEGLRHSAAAHQAVELTMTVQVTERDESKMSHEGLAAGVRIWDVHQQGQLVGMFHEEHLAQQYRSELEVLENQRTPQ
jgi:hypothetical protein